jgi:nucleolar protein 9
LLPHAARLAGSPYARFFTRGLALSLLQRKPDEWRRQHATPSSGGGANTATSSPNKDHNNGSKATAPSAVADHHDEDPEGDGAGTSSPERGRGRKKRKRSAAEADEIEALFDDAIGRKVVRSALEPVPAPAVKSETLRANLRSKQGRGEQGDRSGDQDRQAAELGAVVDAIKVAPRHEGKKRSKRRLGPA